MNLSINKERKRSRALLMLTTIETPNVKDTVNFSIRYKRLISDGDYSCGKM
jgi:hypothetical protein